ncbi:protein saal1 isoform X1 [Megalops cyprinoides]|uniref:protein saal1 isoform X1 n=1 Tax=Megalops cyprinoides TaxID=118141 RepID=UPI001863E11A|nr:protein saal1 isoform X1 [Megalops cyprinoides]
MIMERGGETEESQEELNARSPSPKADLDSMLHRNPSPPSNQEEDKSHLERESIGETLYSKHWLFSTLTCLIQTVVKHDAMDPGIQVELPEEEEGRLCKMWDMAMDEDVAGFLQEFKATDILLGAIAKSHCPRLTEICVGILGNMACFPEICLSLSDNKDLGEVLLLLLGDSDPPTLLETSRLLLTCLAQPSVAPQWLERFRQQEPVCSRLCFIMCSSTNVDLLVKVGELVDKLFDLDEKLMKSWITARPSEADTGSHLLLAPSLLEAAKQLRAESPEGLEVYLHAVQLLTTVEEGIQALVEHDGVREQAWTLLCEVICEDLCQLDDPPIILQEQKGLLASTLAVLSSLSVCQDQQYCQLECNLPLLGSLLRVLQYLSECQQRVKEGEDSSGKGPREDDVQLLAVRETATEFLAHMLTNLNKDVLSELLKRGYLTKDTCMSAVKCLLPQHSTAVQYMVSLLSEAEPNMADIVRVKFSTLKS